MPIHLFDDQDQNRRLASKNIKSDSLLKQLQADGATVRIRDGNTWKPIKADELIKLAENNPQQAFDVQISSHVQVADMPDASQAQGKAVVAVYTPTASASATSIGPIFDALEKQVEQAANKGTQFFVAPEYLFARQTVNLDGNSIQSSFSSEDQVSLQAKLEMLAGRFPGMVIVAGTLLWEDDTHLRHAALVLHDGRASLHDKPRDPLSDSPFNVALAHTDKSPLFGHATHLDLEAHDLNCRINLGDEPREHKSGIKHFDIQLIPANALKTLNHHVHEGGHVFIADRITGASHFIGNNKTTLPLNGGNTGLAIATCNVAKPTPNHAVENTRNGRSLRLAKPFT
ncbi:hypothetical protein [Chitinivorax sp. B]|uniref:hypothetical protein n=1 Tax=Chitinivorax sp. B TaxID=2502235 RepID=UPI0010F8FE0E|nr:hypothetical protein [Chitinivorax sp. B]